MSACVLGLYLWHVRSFSAFYVLDDEFGYWSNGALLAGYDWSGTLRGVANYSYGYGFLLAPIIKVFDTPELAYQAAIVLNSILGIVTFGIILLCFQELYSQVKYYKRLFIAAAVCLNSNYIVNTHIAWSETLLNLLIWVLIYLLIKFFQQKKMSYLILASICCVFSLMVHTRMISIVLSFLFIVIVALKEKKIDVKKQGLFFLIFVGELLIWYLLKSYFKETLWGNNAGDVNDFAGELQKIAGLFTSKGIINFGMIILGQLLYCGVSTLLLSYFCLFYVICRIYDVLKRKLQKLSTTEYLFAFLLVCLSITVCMGSLALINANRIDHYIYGRYIELIIIPIIGLSSLEIFCVSPIKYKSNLGSCSVIAFICSGYLIGYKILKEGASKYSIACSNAIFSFIDEDSLNIDKMLFTVIALFLLLAVIRYFFKRRYIYIVAGVIAFYGGFNALRSIDAAIVPVHKNYSRIYSLVGDVQDELNDKTIYFLLDNKDYWGKSTSKAIFQMAMKDKKIIAKTVEELEQETGNYYLLGSNASPFLERPGGLTIKHSLGNYFVWEKGSGVNNHIDISLNSFSSQNRNTEIEDKFISNGEKGFLLYGPYYILEPSNYKVKLNVKVINGEQENSKGYFEVVSGSTILGRKDIINSGMIMLDFCLEESLPNIELRLYIDEGAIFEVTNVEMYKG